MWARVVEFMLACWLALSPFIFRHPPQDRFLWNNDFACSILVALFALLSFYPPLKRMHLFTIGVALWLWILGYISYPNLATIPEQNSVIMGLFLLMLAIVPSHSHHLSPSWEKFMRKK